MSADTDTRTYADLTDKQQAVVDELVDDPMAQNQEIADRADVSRSLVAKVKENWPDVIESRLNAAGRYSGEERTEGDPFPGLAEDAEAGFQTIQERPATDGTDETALTVDLTRSDVETILVAGEIPDGLQRALVADVVARAFTPASE